MAQIDNVFTAFWMNTATAPWTPLTGLSATITIIDDTWVVVINAEAMTNLGVGWYKYIFTSMDVNKNYLYTCNPWVTAYIDSGVTDKRMNNIDSAISDMRVGGGWSVNLSGVTASISNIWKRIDKSQEEIIAKIESSQEEIENKIDSEKLDISPILDKIDSIEIPEYCNDEKEAKKSNKILTALNKKVSGYIDKEKSQNEQEMQEKMEEHMKLMDEMEIAYWEMEKENQSEKSDILESADDIIAELEKEKTNARKDTIETIKKLIL